MASSKNDSSWFDDNFEVTYDDDSTLRPSIDFDTTKLENTSQKNTKNTKRKKKANPDSLEKKEELVTAETDQTPEQNQEEIAAKVARKLNRIPFYPKDWKDSFGLSVEEHKKALETNLTDGYIEFSATR